jgi:hypothetical protein
MCLLCVLIWNFVQTQSRSAQVLILTLVRRVFGSVEAFVRVVQRLIHQRCLQASLQRLLCVFVWTLHERAWTLLH